MQPERIHRLSELNEIYRKTLVTKLTVECSREEKGSLGSSSVQGVDETLSVLVWAIVISQCKCVWRAALCIDGPWGSGSLENGNRRFQGQSGPQSQEGAEQCKRVHFRSNFPLTILIQRHMKRVFRERASPCRCGVSLDIIFYFYLFVRLHSM